MRSLATSFVALSLAMTPALAQQPMENVDTMDAASADLIRTRDIVGGNVYVTEEGADADAWLRTVDFDAVDPAWTDIGEIEDLVLNSNGRLRGVVAEIGGFLDVADKHVMLELDSMDLVPLDDGGYAVVTRYTQEELMARPDLDEAFWE